MGCDGKEHLRLMIERRARRASPKGSLASQVYNFVPGLRESSDWEMMKRTGDFNKYETDEWEHPKPDLEHDFTLLHTRTHSIRKADIPPLAQWNGRIILFAEGEALHTGSKVAGALIKMCRNGIPSECAKGNTYKYTGEELADRLYNFLIVPWGLDVQLTSIDLLFSYGGYMAKELAKQLSTRHGIKSGIQVRGPKLPVSLTEANLKCDQNCLAFLKEPAGAVKCGIKDGLEKFFTARGETFGCYGCETQGNKKVGDLKDATQAFILAETKTD